MISDKEYAKTLVARYYESAKHKAWISQDDLDAYYRDCDKFNIGTSRETDIREMLRKLDIEMSHYITDIHYALTDYGKSQDRELDYDSEELKNVNRRIAEVVALSEMIKAFTAHFQDGN